MTSENEVHRSLVREFELLQSDPVSWPITSNMVEETPTRFNSWGRKSLSFGTMDRSALGSPTTTSVLGSRRKQACFMEVMTAVTEPSRALSALVQARWKEEQKDVHLCRPLNLSSPIRRWVP